MSSSEPKKAKVDELPTGKSAEEHIDHHGAGSNFSRVILVALDTSPTSETAFKWALENMVDPKKNDLIVLVTVREPVLVPGAYGYMDFGDYIAEAEEQSRLRAHALVKSYGQKLLQHFDLHSATPSSNESGITVKGIVMRGDPRDELVRKSSELGASSLIMGSRGLGTFKRAFLGSVSDYVVHHSEVPVVIVKDKTESK